MGAAAATPAVVLWNRDVATEINTNLYLQLFVVHTVTVSNLLQRNTKKEATLSGLSVAHILATARGQQWP